MRKSRRLGDPVLQAICAHAPAESPLEACGFVYSSGRYRLAINVQENLYAREVADDGRRATTGYEFSASDTLELVRSFDTADPAVMIVHSHPAGAGAYLSETDRDAAVVEGRPAYDVDQCVVAVDAQGDPTDIAHFGWVDNYGFIEVDHFPVVTLPGERQTWRRHPCQPWTPTPIVDLSGVLSTRESGVFVKYEAALPSGSHKERAARMAVARAESMKELRPGSGKRLIAPTGGNYGAALAKVARDRGYVLTAVVPDNYPETKIKLLRLMGADVRLADHGLGNNAHGILATKLYWEDPSQAILVDQFSDEANVWGHYATGHELVAQLEDEPVDCFVAGIGSGAHLTGIGRVLRHRWPNIEIVAVQPAGCDVLRGEFRPHAIPGLAVGMCPPILDKTLISRVESVDDEEAVAMLRHVLRREQLSIGISSAANLVVCARLLRGQDRPRRIVTIAYDRADAYLDRL